MEKELILDEARKITKASDFHNWDLRDMSDLFWTKLGEYVKHPTNEALVLIRRALDWACHEDNALANSFNHALKWAGIDDLWEEAEKQGYEW